MKNEEKQLLLSDISARLIYGVMCNITDFTAEREEDENFDASLLAIERTESGGYATFVCAAPEYPIWGKNRTQLIKPYLRPMANMTKKEKEELSQLLKDNEKNPYGEINSSGCDNLTLFCSYSSGIITDWLNKHHFDYRMLIEKGLAIEAPEEMYGEVEE